MNIAQKIAKESTITFSGLLYGNVNRYLYTALLARWVGVEYLGIYSIANSIILICEVLAKMGLESGIMRFVSRLDPQQDRLQIRSMVSSALKMTGILSVMVMVILILGSGWLVKSVFDESPLLHIVLIVFALTMPFNAFTHVSAFATQGFKLMKYKVFVTQIVNPTVLFGVMVLSFWFISKEAALILPMVMTGVIGCILIFKFLQSLSGVTIKSVLSTPFNKPLLTFSIPLMFVTILQTFMHWMDILMLGYFTDATTVGLYHPAARTAGLLQALLLSFISIYAPMMAQFHGAGDRAKMDHTYKLVSRWLLICAIPISAVFIIFPGKVLLLFGPEYLPSAKILVILTGATFIQAVLGAAGPALSMSGHTKLVLWNTIGAFVLNFGLNIFLIPKYGIVGAAIATLISLTILGFARIIEVQIILRMNFIDRKVIKPILAGLIVFTGLFFIKDFIMPFHTLITLILAGIFSVGVYGFILWILKVEEEDLDFLKGLKVLKGRK